MAMKTRRQRRLKRTSRTAGRPPRQMLDASVIELVDYVLQGSDDVHVVVVPLLWRPNDGVSSRLWYFIVAASERNRGFRCDQIVMPDDDRAVGGARRAEFLMALMTRRPLVIHDCGDEIQMVRLCEVLWPGERVSRLRTAVEAEQAVSRATS